MPQTHPGSTSGSTSGLNMSLAMIREVFARSSIAHCVVFNLRVGGVYTIRRFTVAPNKKMYRLRRGDEILIQLESNSAITKVEHLAPGFMPQPFALMAFEDIAYDDKKYLIGTTSFSPRMVNIILYFPFSYMYKEFFDMNSV